MSSRRSSGSDRARSGSDRRGSPWSVRLGGAAVMAVLSLVALLAPALAASEAAAQGQAAPTTPASPPWYEAYQRAVADAELENWEGVTTKIDQALKLKAKSERNVRTYGMWH